MWKLLCWLLGLEEWINKKHAEEMIGWYLRKTGVLKSEPRFRWNKPEICIMPVSLGRDY